MIGNGTGMKQVVMVSEQLAEMVCRFKSQFTSECLLAFQWGYSPRSHFYLFTMLRRVAETCPINDDPL